jgi:tetratricopeptide (TPR) repeat protein
MRVTSGPQDGGGTVQPHPGTVPVDASGGSGQQVGHGNVQTNYFTYHLPGNLATRPDSPAAGHAHAIAGDIPARPVAFVERPGVAQLRRAWDAGTRVCVVQALTGGPGVGKTQTAAAYARDRAADGWPLVAWVAAETRDQLLAGIAGVASALGVADPDGDSVKSGQRLRRFLVSFPGPALIVFDNAARAELEMLAGLLPSVGGVQVVITTRDRAFTRLGESVGVGLFTSGESVAYLSQRTGLPADAAASAIAHELGHLPVALAQAAALISERAWDYVTYQTKLHALPAAGFLARHEGDPYPRGAVEAIALAVGDAGEQDATGLTRMIIGLLSVLSPDGAPRSVLSGLRAVAEADGLVDFPPHWDDALDQVLGRLVNGSIVTRAETGDAFSMHRLVGRVVREREEAAGRLLPVISIAATLLEGRRIPEAQGWQRRAEGSLIVSQISAVWIAFAKLPRVSEELAGDLAARLTQLRNWSVSQLVVAEDLSRAVALAVQVQTDGERMLGADHPASLAAGQELAYAYQAAGRVSEAVALFEGNLTGRERVLGRYHPDTLASRNSLAVAYIVTTRLPEAVELTERNLADRKRLLGPDHPDTLASRNNLARVIEAAGVSETRGSRAAHLFREAVDLYERNLTNRERVLGRYHPDTLASRNNLAVAYILAGRFREAVVLYERNLADYERLLGSDHPDTLAARHNIAVAYASAGRVREAIALNGRNLNDRERLLGPDHPDTLASRNNLASAYETAGRIGHAIDLYERNLADRERLLGPGHPDTLSSRNGLANAHLAKAHLLKAHGLFRRNAVEARRELEPGRPGRRGAVQTLVAWYILLIFFAVMLLVAGQFAVQNDAQWIIPLFLVALVPLLAFMYVYVWGRLLGVRDWKFLSAPWFLRIRLSVPHRGQLEFSRGARRLADGLGVTSPGDRAQPE